MAKGDIKVRFNAKREIVMVENAIATTSAPTAATDGVRAYPDNNNLASDTGHCYTGQNARSSTLVVVAEGTGTVTCEVRLWGYIETLGEWAPVYSSGALSETETDKVKHVKQLTDLGHFDRLELQVVALGGTDPSISAVLITAQESF